MTGKKPQSWSLVKKFTKEIIFAYIYNLQIAPRVKQYVKHIVGVYIFTSFYKKNTSKFCLISATISVLQIKHIGHAVFKSFQMINKI